VLNLLRDDRISFKKIPNKNPIMKSISRIISYKKRSVVALLFYFLWWQEN